MDHQKWKGEKMSNTKKGEEVLGNPDASTDMYEVTEWMDRLGTPKAVFIGTATMNGWRPGKQVSEAEYIKAVECFSSAPAGRMDHA